MPSLKVLVIGLIVGLFAGSMVGYNVAPKGIATTESEQLSQLEGQINAIQNQLQDLSSRLTTAEGRLATLDSSLAQLSQGLSNLDTELHNEILRIQNDVSALQIQISTIRNDITTIQNAIATIQTGIANLQSKIADLEARVVALESKKTVTVRIWFLSFDPDAQPPGGEDWLIDIKLENPAISGISSYVYGRTGHSRFVTPNYLDLSVDSTWMGANVKITIYAYWHLSDQLIDINPNPADGRTYLGATAVPDGARLILWYTIGTTTQGSVDGNDDGYLLDPYDAYLVYKIETLS
jgi:prefoldin subunit 5